MTDRRRVNGPLGGTATPIFAQMVTETRGIHHKRTRAPNELRKIFLRTGLTPSASGSAYLELEHSSISATKPQSISNLVSGLKLTCTVHGPRPLPRSAPFSPQLLLSTRVKFAPFASRQRRGYVPEYGERDLSAHLETALRGVLIGERWPKSGADVIVTVLEGEEEDSCGDGVRRPDAWGMMTILSGCITVASAAIVDSGIDSVDLVTGGVAALVRHPTLLTQLVLDPCPSDHEEILAACVIGYLQSRNEITEIWAKGEIEDRSNSTESDVARFSFESLVDQAVDAAIASRRVLTQIIKEATDLRIKIYRIWKLMNPQVRHMSFQLIEQTTFPLSATKEKEITYHPLHYLIFVTPGPSKELSDGFSKLRNA